MSMVEYLIDKVDKLCIFTQINSFWFVQSLHSGNKTKIMRSGGLPWLDCYSAVWWLSTNIIVHIYYVHLKNVIKLDYHNIN